MKKDKEWLKQAIKDSSLISSAKLYDLIDQLDEPQKPVVPQFVADCIEEERTKIIDWHTEVPERFFLILGHKLHYTALANTNISDWVFGGNEEKLYQALKYGYEVEKEKRYQVKIPVTVWDGDASELKEHTSFLAYDITSGETRILSTTRCRGDYRTDLTESEIKAIDKRYWAFAEEVTK